MISSLSGHELKWLHELDDRPWGTIKDDPASAISSPIPEKSGEIARLQKQHQLLKGRIDNETPVYYIVIDRQSIPVPNPSSFQDSLQPVLSKQLAPITHPTQSLNYRVVKDVDSVKRKLSKIMAAAVDSVNPSKPRLPSRSQIKTLPQAIPISSSKEAGAATVKGKKIGDNEDTVLSTTIQFDDQTFHLYGIFDGHSQSGDDKQLGRTCAQLAAAELPQILTKRLKEFEKEPKRVAFFNALKLTFAELNDKLREAIGADTDYGTTATIALITEEGSLWVEGAGDSRALLITKEEFIPLSIDAKPSAPLPASSGQEIPAANRSVYNRGGIVTNLPGQGPRCGASLAVTRSLGHPMNSGINPRGKVFHAENRSSDTSFLVIASDGLWDVLDSKHVWDKVLNLAKVTSCQNIAKTLVQEAINAGSQDDTTVLIVKIPPHPLLKQVKERVPTLNWQVNPYGVVYAEVRNQQTEIVETYLKDFNCATRGAGQKTQLWVTPKKT